MIKKIIVILTRYDSNYKFTMRFYDSSKNNINLKLKSLAKGKESDFITNIIIYLIIIVSFSSIEIIEKLNLSFVKNYIHIYCLTNKHKIYLKKLSHIYANV